MDCAHSVTEMLGLVDASLIGPVHPPWMLNFIQRGVQQLLLALGVGAIMLGCLLALDWVGFAAWVRTAWMLRRLPRATHNYLYGGLSEMLTSNRLRAMQRLNEAAVGGSGAFYFNMIWRQVRVLACLNASVGHARVRATPEADMPHTCSNIRRDWHNGLQTVVISDPHLIDDLLHDTRLYKPAEPDYINFRKVGTPSHCPPTRQHLPTFPHMVCHHKYTHTTATQAKPCA